MEGASDESDLVRRAQRADLSAFNQLVVRYQDLAYNVAYRLLGDAEPAADATQDAFISAYAAISRFRGGSFRSWLLRIVTNACYDLLRTRRRRPTTSLDAMLEADSATPAHFPDPGETPEGAALRHEVSRQIQAALLSLPADQRVAVVLSDVQGLSYDEIAQATSASLGTVKSRLSRGRAHLRALLSKHGELLPPRLRHDNG